LRGIVPPPPPVILEEAVSNFYRSLVEIFATYNSV